MADNSSARLLNLIRNLPENSPILSEDFAVLLGLKQSAVSPHKDILKGDEYFRKALLEAYMDRVLKEDEFQQDIIWSRFCALYLPDLVNRFLDPWSATDGSHFQTDPDAKEDYRLFNPWLRMLVMVQHIPYFGKYLRSKQLVASGNLDLTRVLGERLSHVAPRWDRRITPTARRTQRILQRRARDILQLLSTLLTTFMNRDPEKVLPIQTKQKLLPFVKGWCDMFYNPSNVMGEDEDGMLGVICSRMFLHLSSSRDDAGASLHGHMLKKVKNQLKGWDQCGLPICKVTNGDNKCNSNHQALHWKWPSGAHKQMCFQTKF
ncbi:hypothetical protein BT96DRAFT_934760 [Gymnopus androsaceus JB14]|uniref:Uncharacterized protein n=1 Tax=Gymnopus androsaceus JB14 TaxID=1447944 RepID=A0A6A4I4P9_9AGAR|nr:hypothetical protein BT96DRAFT_934760 [Gymnopus androsaceus JB14]